MANVYERPKYPDIIITDVYFFNRFSMNQYSFGIIFAHRLDTGLLRALHLKKIIAEIIVLRFEISN